MRRVHANKRNVTLCGLFSLGLALVAFLTPSVSADGNSQHIAISPTSQSLSIDPGKTAQGAFTVLNQGSDAFLATISAAPFWVQGESYDPKFTQLPGTTEVSKWVQLPATTSKSMKPGETWDIAYAVNVPANVQPGGYYAVIFAESSPEAATKNIVAHNRLGHVLYIAVNGTVKKSGEVSGTALKHVLFNGNVNAPIIVKNTGGVHFTSTVTTKITDMFGREVFTHTEERYVLPQTARRFDMSWHASSAFGIYRISQSASIPSGTVTLPRATVIVIEPLLIVFLVIFILCLWLFLKRLSLRKKPTYKL